MCFNKSLVHAEVGESLLWISKSQSGLRIKNTRQAFKSPITQATPHSNELTSLGAGSRPHSFSKLQCATSPG